MAGGLLYIQRIRNYKVYEVSEAFKHQIDLFARQIGISQTVRLVQSELVKVPVAVGWLKPMILLPMGVILQLPPEQIESILWHELAHIRRRDYLVNILQGLVETVFFFNPGLLWLSSLIRAEREACCDDIVLSRTNRKANYLEALLAIADENNRYMNLAMGIGSGSQLRDRMKRMISQENKRLSIAEKVVLIIGLVMLSAFTTLPKTTQAAVQHLFDVAIRKTDRSTHSKIVAYSTKEQPGVRQKIELTVVDTTHGKPKTIASFRSILFKNSDADPANNDISTEDTTGKKYHFIVADNKLVSMEINGEKVNESDLPKYQYMIAQIDAVVLEKRHISQEDIANFKANNPAAKFKAKQGFEKGYVDSMKVKSVRDSYKGKKLDSLKSKEFNGWTKTDETGAARAKFEAMRDRMHQDSTSFTTQKNRALSVIADLVHDKAVPDPASVKWFGLSNTEFIVNGQKQPDEMQQRYKAKFGVYQDYGLYYGPVQMHGTGVFIDADPSRPPLPPGSPRQPKNTREPRSGYLQPKYADTSAWKMRQLIKQQQIFTADQAKRRQKQQDLTSDKARQLGQIIKKQQLLLTDQPKELEGLNKQWRTSKSGIDLKPAITNVIADLVSANVIQGKSDLIRFNLTNSVLMVNGIKQPEELHQKLKAKYLEQSNYDAGFTADPNFGLHFNAKNGNRGLGITSESDSP